MNSSLYNQYFIWEQEEKSVQNFRTFTVDTNVAVIHNSLIHEVLTKKFKDTFEVSFENVNI